MRFFFVLTVLVISACATKPVAHDAQKKTGHWDTKVLVRDLKNAKSNTLNIDFVAIKAEFLRAEVTGTFGVQVASLVMNKNKISYAVHTQKKYFEGVLSDRSLGPLLQIQLNPRILFYVLFDQPLPEASWICTLSADGLPAECNMKTTDFKVIWAERNGESKRVTIRRPDFEIQVYVKTFNPELPTKVQQDPGFFSISVPDSYKSYQIN